MVFIVHLDYLATICVIWHNKGCFPELLSQVGRRILWLLILVLANGLTTKVIAMNDQILKEIVLLAAFIPLLIGLGGNVGNQSATIIVRAIATKDIPDKALVLALYLTTPLPVF